MHRAVRWAQKRKKRAHRKINEMVSEAGVQGALQALAVRMLARINAAGSETSLRHLGTYARCVKLL